jgi:cell division protein FtsW (lipid II flippase)
MTEERSPAVGATGSAETDPLGPDVRWANLAPMIAYLVVVGLVLTLATWKNLAWAYITGLLLTAVWVAGFVVDRNRPERWFRW